MSREQYLAAQIAAEWQWLIQWVTWASWIVAALVVVGAVWAFLVWISDQEGVS